jgi:hypothetical protein
MTRAGGDCGGGVGVPGGEEASSGDGSRARRWYTHTGSANHVGGAGAAPEDDDAESSSSEETEAAPEDEAPGPSLSGEVGAASEDDGPGPVEPWAAKPGRKLGDAVPTGDHGKGGWTTVSVGNREKGSRSGLVGSVLEVEKGKTDSSNTTWREMRTRREVSSKQRYPL